MKPDAPASAQSRTYRTAAAVDDSATPAMTGTRPPAVRTAVATTCRFSSGANDWFSPSDPHMTSPLTPDAIRASRCRAVPSRSSDWSWRN